MTVIRLGDGRLILHSPVPISPELRGELDALGPVGFIVVPRAHGKFAEQASRMYPAAELLVLGFRLQEVVLYHRSSRTLVLTDLCFNIQRSASGIAHMFFRANGMWQRFGPSRIIRRVAVSERAALQRSLERVLLWDFERIVPGHGDVIEQGGRAALRAAWPTTGSSACLR